MYVADKVAGIELYITTVFFNVADVASTFYTFIIIIILVVYICDEKWGYRRYTLHFTKCG